MTRLICRERTPTAAPQARSFPLTSCISLMCILRICVVIWSIWGTYETKYFPALGSPLMVSTRFVFFLKP